MKLYKIEFTVQLSTVVTIVIYSDLNMFWQHILRFYLEILIFLTFAVATSSFLSLNQERLV